MMMWKVVLSELNFFACDQWTAAVSSFHNLVMGGVHVSKKGCNGCFCC